MTWTSSHVAMGAMLLYLFSGQDFKRELKQNPLLFFMLTLGAAAPDIDLIFGVHRTITHTLFLPFGIILLSPVLSLQSRYENLDRNVRIFAIMWFIHIMFDMTFGPVPLFYPVDQRFFDFEMGTILGLDEGIFLPVTVEGFYLDTEFIEEAVGASVFFVNWTSEERMRIFGGTTTKIPIESLFIHVTIFLWYLKVVVSPAWSSIWKDLLSRNIGILARADNDYRSIKYSFMAEMQKIHSKTLGLTLLLLVLTSYLSGPHYGETWTDENTNSDQVIVLTDSMRTLGQRTYKLPENSTLEITLHVDPSTLEYSVFAISLPLDSANFITTSIDDLVDQFNDNNITRDEFGISYTQFLMSMIPDELIFVINGNTAANWIFNSNIETTVVFGLLDWDPSFFFFRTFQSTARYTIGRKAQYSAGIMLMVIFSIMFVGLILKQIIFDRERLAKNI